MHEFWPLLGRGGGSKTQFKNLKKLHIVSDMQTHNIKPWEHNILKKVLFFLPAQFFKKLYLLFNYQRPYHAADRISVVYQQPYLAYPLLSSHLVL